MRDLTDAEIDAAIERGARLHETEPLAVSARYDARRKRLIVELYNGCIFIFPVRLAQDLCEASDDDIAEVEVLGVGTGLHWEKLDIDLSVKGLLSGIFGTKSWMAQLGGRSKSPAKSAAARENGKKGGRPKKTG